MKKPKRILCAVLALLMLLGAAAAVSVRPAYAAKTEAELEEERRRWPHWNRKRRSSRKS